MRSQLRAGRWFWRMAPGSGRHAFCSICSMHWAPARTCGFVHSDREYAKLSHGRRARARTVTQICRAVSAWQI